MEQLISSKGMVMALSIILISGCQTPPAPSANYNITNPNQTAMDQLMGSRHFTTISAYRAMDQFIELTQHRKQAIVVNGHEYQQLLIRPSEPWTAQRMNILEEGLRRSCWAIRDDATLQLISTTRRGVESSDVMHACISDRLGNEYPLFAFAYVSDNFIGDYFMQVAPTRLYSDNEYLCKLKEEGYPFATFLYCN